MDSKFNGTQNLIQALFARYFQANEGYIEYRGIGKTGSVKQRFCDRVDYAIGAIEMLRLTSWNEQGRNIYFGVCPRKGKSGTKYGVASVTALWADLDDRNYQEGKEEALMRLQAFQPMPSAIVDSGHGYHAYWFLDEPAEIDDISQIEGYIKGIAKTLGGDYVHDLGRVMRLPGFLNVKNPDSPVPCVLLDEHFCPEIRYRLADFEGYWIGVAPKSTPVPFGAVPEEIPEKFWCILKADDRLSSAWYGTRPMPNDNSRSGYDMSVASIAAQYGFTPGQIEAILSACPSGKGKEGSLAYRRLTILKAMNKTI
jgi:hypothetical protein